jgi:hypothetical protein
LATFAPSSLPPIDAVDVVDLAGVRAKGVDGYMAAAAGARSVRLSGAGAERIAALWRGLPPGKHARCHIPPFGLRFYRGGQLICQASICWQCNNLVGDAGGEASFYEFDASHPTSRELLHACERAAGRKAGELTRADQTGV